MVFEHASYKKYLRAVLADNISANPQYSLRAFAKKLEMSPATLSQVLSDKKNFSRERAMLVAEKLKLDKSESEYFIQLVELDRAKTPRLKSQVLEKLQEINPKRDVNDLSVDVFKLMSEWYYPTVLEMLDLYKNSFKVEEVARRLNISPIQVQEALDRLERLGLIEKTPSGEIKKSHAKTVVGSQVPNEALRNFHEQMLTKAQQSLRTQTPNEKYVGSETFCFDESDLEEVNELTEKYFQQVLSLAKKKKDKSHVYHLGIQFFKLHK